MLKHTIIKKTEITCAVITLSDDLVVRVLIKKGIELTLTQLEVLFASINDLVAGHYYPVIYKTEDNNVIVGEGGVRFFKESENLYPRACVAIVARSLSLKIIVNFYLKFKKATTKSKVFNTEEDAEAWCYEQQKLINSSKLLVL